MRKYFLRYEQIAQNTAPQGGAGLSMQALGGMMKGVLNKNLVPVIARQDVTLELGSGPINRLKRRGEV